MNGTREEWQSTGSELNASDGRGPGEGHTAGGAAFLPATKEVEVALPLA